MRAGPGAAAAMLCAIVGLWGRGGPGRPERGAGRGRAEREERRVGNEQTELARAAPVGAHSSLGCANGVASALGGGGKLTVGTGRLWGALGERWPWGAADGKN